MTETATKTGKKGKGDKPSTKVEVVKDEKVVDNKKEVKEKTPKAEKPEASNKPVVEDVDSSDSDDSVPDIVEGNKEADAAGVSEDMLNKSKQSRSERKARKAMTKLGLKLVPSICRVTIRRAKSIIFVISPAEVYKASTSDTYIIFGEAKVENMSSNSQLAAAEKLRNSGLTSVASKDKEASSNLAKTAIAEESEDDDEEPDATGLNETDISLVMKQADVSRKKAIKALHESNNDIVSAIMALSG